MSVIEHPLSKIERRTVNQSGPHNHWKFGPGCSMFDVVGRRRGAPRTGALRRGGFSLIEVMVAILILGIALVGLTEGVTATLSSSKESELQTTAALFAAGQIELLRAEGGITDAETEGDCGEALPLYRWKQTITGTGIDGLHDVLVVVENARSGEAIYELRTLLFEPPDNGSVSTRPNGRKESSGRGGRSR